MISANDYSQKLNISRIKMFNKLFLRSIKINKYNSSERNENIKNKIENDRLNKSLFKFI